MNQHLPVNRLSTSPYHVAFQHCHATQRLPDALSTQQSAGALHFSRASWIGGLSQPGAWATSRYPVAQACGRFAPVLIRRVPATNGPRRSSALPCACRTLRDRYVCCARMDSRCPSSPATVPATTAPLSSYQRARLPQVDFFRVAAASAFTFVLLSLVLVGVGNYFANMRRRDELDVRIHPRLGVLKSWLLPVVCYAAGMLTLLIAWASYVGVLETSFNGPNFQRAMIAAGNWDYRRLVVVQGFGGRLTRAPLVLPARSGTPPSSALPLPAPHGSPHQLLPHSPRFTHSPIHTHAPQVRPRLRLRAGGQHPAAALHAGVRAVPRRSEPRHCRRCGRGQPG